MIARSGRVGGDLAVYPRAARGWMVAVGTPALDGVVRGRADASGEGRSSSGPRGAPTPRWWRPAARVCSAPWPQRLERARTSCRRCDCVLVPRRATAATRLGTEERTQRTRRRCAPARLVRRWRSSRGWRRGARSPRCRGGVRRQECDSCQGRCTAGRNAPGRCTTMERVTSCKARRATERSARVGWIRTARAEIADDESGPAWER